MTVIHFEKVRARRSRKFRCAVCGQRATRSVTIEKTINPWNKDPKTDRPLNRQQVYNQAVEAAEKAIAGYTTHEKCEASQ